MFTLEFYETPNKLAPLEEFLEDLKKKDKSLFAKVLRDMELLESKGNLLREHYTKTHRKWNIWIKNKTA